MEQVWSRYELGLVRKIRIIRIKIKDNCCFGYEKKVENEITQCPTVP